ncbi:MAG: oligoendopeptidase F [Peptoniphilaceae bacterium]|nr:oligoendopeptidase F [Peptoniphilaceae bacterium]
MKREEIDNSLKWKTEKIFENDEKFYEDLKNIDKLTEKVTEHKGKILNSADSLYETLKDVEKCSREIEKIVVFSNLKKDEDTTNSDYQKMNQYAMNAYSKFYENLSFLKPEILKEDREKIEKFIEEKDELKIYEHFFDDLFREKAHTLSESEEKIIASFSPLTENPENTYSLFSNADLSFHPAHKNGEKVKITDANFTLLQEDEDRNFRKEVYENYYGSYKHFENTASSLLDGELKANNIISKLKKYKSARAMSLHAGNIPEEVYDNLIETIHENMDIMERYTSLRKKILSVDTLHFYDVYMPLVKSFDKKYSFDEAKEIVLNALKPLGEEYVQQAKKGFEDRWFDVIPNDGKRSGAYSSGGYDTDPYILLNYNGTLDDIFTVIHELGHSMHSFYTRKTQPFIYGHYSIFLAEIASTTNELLLLNYLLDNVKDEDEKTYLLNYYMNSFKSTVFRQTMFAEFEHKANKLVENGQPVVAKTLNKIYGDLNKLYFGKDMEVDDKISVERARIPHFYMFYYVYQYATGFSAAVLFSQKILKGNKDDVEKYLRFLKAGESKYPTDVLKEAGVDLTKKEVVQKAMDVARETLKELEKRF